MSNAPIEARHTPDENAIRALRQGYFTCVDSRNWDGFAALFCVDAVFDRSFGGSVRDPVSGLWTPPIADEPQLVHGRGAIVAMAQTAVAGTTTRHAGTLQHIAFDGPDTAEATWAMTDELRGRDGQLILAGTGHYEDRYRRNPDGVWRIAFCRLTRTSITRGDGQRIQEQ